jgi:hypothetical protein
MLKTCYNKAISKDAFFVKLKECVLTTYIRGGRISGIIFCEKKFRLKTIGFTEKRLQELDKPINRKEEISRLRGNNKENIIRRKR